MAEKFSAISVLEYLSMEVIMTEIIIKLLDFAITYLCFATFLDCAYMGLPFIKLSFRRGKESFMIKKENYQQSELEKKEILIFLYRVRMQKNWKVL